MLREVRMIAEMNKNGSERQEAVALLASDSWMTVIGNGENFCEAGTWKGILDLKFLKKSPDITKVISGGDHNIFQAYSKSIRYFLNLGKKAFLRASLDKILFSDFNFKIFESINLKKS